jgi:CRISPR type I-E-associated protein CasB/Cse2
MAHFQEQYMTAPSDQSPPAAQAPSRDIRFVQHLLIQRRNNVAARSALRRGDTPALADRAVPYLQAWQLRPHEVNPALLFAAAICRHSDIEHDMRTSFGRAAFSTLTPADQSDAAGTSVGRRVVATQRQTLPLAHRQFTGLLTSISQHPQLGFDWNGLWRTYRGWDHPDPQRRRMHRRRLLLDFYGTAPSDDTD